MTQTNSSDWISDERAVSPVIGVILMVAITVILAAVIGTFVLDLGQSTGQSAPQASLSVTIIGSTSNVSIEHTGGDAIGADQTRIIIENASGGSVTFDPASTSSTLTVGNSVEANTSTADIDGALTDMVNNADNPFTISRDDQITVRVIDTESQRQIFETTVTA